MSVSVICVQVFGHVQSCGFCIKIGSKRTSSRHALLNVITQSLQRDRAHKTGSRRSRHFDARLRCSNNSRRSLLRINWCTRVLGDWVLATILHKSRLHGRRKSTCLRVDVMPTRQPVNVMSSCLLVGVPSFVLVRVKLPVVYQSVKLVVGRLTV